MNILRGFLVGIVLFFLLFAIVGVALGGVAPVELLVIFVIAVVVGVALARRNGHRRVDSK